MAGQTSFNFKINEKNEPIVLEPGAQLYILGANGTGKSALMQHIAASQTEPELARVRRIVAHRRSWFNYSTSTGLGSEKSVDILKKEQRKSKYYSSMWKEEDQIYDPSQQEVFLNKLVAKENQNARLFRKYVKQEELVPDSAEEEVFDAVNQILNFAKIRFNIDIENDTMIAIRTDTNDRYKIEQLSDGERNALIIASAVFTAEPNTVFLIDEPERHLHRSIIVPLLSELFNTRSDCIFIISTHETHLVTSNMSAHVVVLRSCSWNDNKATNWEHKYYNKATFATIPEDVREAILGPRKKVLFVEGNNISSLDYRLYGALFPDFDVRFVGNSYDVIRSVESIHNVSALHDVKAIGIIDGDNRSEENISKLRQKNVAVLKVYSVESLLCCPEAVEAMEKAKNSQENKTQEIINSALRELNNNKDWQFLRASQLTIQKISHFFGGNSVGRPKELLLNELHEQQEKLNQLIKDKKWSEIIKKHSVKNSSVLSIIANELGMKKDEYINAIIENSKNNSDFSATIKSYIANVGVFDE